MANNITPHPDNETINYLTYKHEPDGETINFFPYNHDIST